MPNKADRDQDARGNSGRGGLGGDRGDRGGGGYQSASDGDRAGGTSGGYSRAPERADGRGSTGSGGAPALSWGDERAFDQAHGLADKSGNQMTWEKAPTLSADPTMDRLKTIEQAAALTGGYGPKESMEQGEAAPEDGRAFQSKDYRAELDAGVQRGEYASNPEFAKSMREYQESYSSQNLTDMVAGLLIGAVSSIPGVGSLASYAMNKWTARAQAPDETGAQYAGRMDAISNRSSLAGPAVGLAGMLGGVNTGPLSNLAGGIASAAQNIATPGQQMTTPEEASRIKPKPQPQTMRTNPATETGNVPTATATMPDPTAAPAPAPYMSQPPAVQEVAPPQTPQTQMPQINLQRYSTWTPGRRNFFQQR